jgi:translin
MEGVERSLRSIENELQQVMGRRERLLKESRDVISSSSRAIVLLHTGKGGAAKKEIDEARTLLKDLRKEGRGTLARYLISPEMEFVEASAVQAISAGKPIPPAAALEVSPEAYLLGLLDTVGEVKRLLLDSIMAGRISKAKRYFEAMEGLYSLLSPFAVFDNVVNGVRRKLDVARMLTEDTRGILAEEVRRESLVSSINSLEKALKK